MFANQSNSINHPALPPRNAHRLPPDDVLIGFAAVLLDRLWKDQKLADGIGDRIELDLLRLEQCSKIFS